MQSRRKTIAVLGRHDFNDAREKHWIKIEVSKIIIHPDYLDDAEFKKSNADIAVLILEIPVIFSNYISPICLPDLNQAAFDMDGVVIGRASTSLSSMLPNPTPLQAFFRSNSSLDCLYSRQDAVIVMSPTSFCALSQYQALCKGF